jgi:hypothetical protein
MWQALCDTVRETGFIYYRDIPDAFMDALKKRLLQDNLTVETLLKANGTFGRIPIQLPVDDEFIKDIRRSSGAAQDRGHCLGSEKSTGSCLGCGACRDEQQRLHVTARRLPSPIRGEQLKARVLASNKTVNVVIKCRIHETQRGLPRQGIAADMARAFMDSDPVLLQLYRGYGGSMIFDQCESEWVHGEDLITLRFQEAAAVKLKELCASSSFLAGINSMLAGKAQALTIGMADVPVKRHITLRIVTPWKCDPANYCKEHALKHTAVRSDNGWMTYQFTKDSLKKHRISSMKARQDETNFIMEIVPGERFNYNEFIRSVVDLPTDKHIVRVFCEAKINV